MPKPSRASQAEHSLSTAATPVLPLRRPQSRRHSLSDPSAATRVSAPGRAGQDAAARARLRILQQLSRVPTMEGTDHQPLSASRRAAARPRHPARQARRARLGTHLDRRRPSVRTLTAPPRAPPPEHGCDPSAAHAARVPGAPPPLKASPQLTLARRGAVSTQCQASACFNGLSAR